MSKLIVTRFIRYIKKDFYLPKKCNAKINSDTVCDCKIWCKYPPDGGKLAYIYTSNKSFQKYNKNNFL